MRRLPKSFLTEDFYRKSNFWHNSVNCISNLFNREVSRFFVDKEKLKTSREIVFKNTPKVIFKTNICIDHKTFIEVFSEKQILKKFKDCFYPVRFMFTFSKYTLFINYESYPLVLDQESWTWVNLINLKFWNKMLGFWDEIREEMSCVISLSLF